MSSPITEDLSSILTPSLFSSIVKLAFPWERSSTLNFSAVGHYIFEEPSKEWVPTCSSALLALRKHPVSSFPSLLDFLPPPSSPSFPTQTLGLTLLLDQAPRHCCSGIDTHWISWFEVLSLKLAHELLLLPENQRADTKSRWVDELDCSFDYWIVTRLWFIAPFVHSEALSDQDIARSIISYLRDVVEQFTGTVDPFRAQQDVITTDIYGFPRAYRAGPPSGEDIGMKEFAFWYQMLMDIHRPIIVKFGRYPYRNSQQGRDDTEDEKLYLKETDHFGEIMDENIKKRIKEDVLTGT